MDEQDWTLLSMIGEDKKLKHISDELFITQPALTYRLNKIEKKFGSELFIRDNKGIKANSKGEYLIQYANRMLDELKYVEEEIYSLSNLVKGNLYIGASNAVAQYVIPNLLSSFLKSYPQVEPHVITGFSPYLIDMLSKEKIHIAFLREDMQWSYKKKLLQRENVYVISKEPVQLDELSQLPRIDYKTNQSLKSIIDIWWKDHFNTPPIITAVVDNADVCLEFVRAGLGYAILTELGLSKEHHLNRIPIIQSNGKPLKRETWIYSSRNSEQFYTVNTFLNFIEQNYDSNNFTGV